MKPKYRIGDVIKSGYITKNGNNYIGVIKGIRQTIFNDYVYLIKIIDKHGKVKSREIFTSPFDSFSEICMI